MGLYTSGGNKIGGMYMADGHGSSQKIGGMYYSNGKGNATKIYSSMYPNGYVLWHSPNDYGIALGGSHSDSPYLLPGNALQFDLNLIRIKNGIKIYFNIVNYYGSPYAGESPIWGWSNSTIPGGYSNSYSLPTEVIEIPLINFNEQNIVYKSRGQGNQASVYASIYNQGITFKSTHGGTIFDIPTKNGISALIINHVEAY